MKSSIFIFILLALTGCSSSSAHKEDSAERYCHQKNGQLTFQNRTFGKVEYCTLPDGTHIEHWRFYLKDRLLPDAPVHHGMLAI
ncbi:DUF333 domain-containing protein [Pantoea sp. AS142]|uniref:DUF333 domain-containing protein n=1 Tax=Pantoea sp. AS142 TaxID=3081292 RepID=UPI003FA76BBD